VVLCITGAIVRGPQLATYAENGSRIPRFLLNYWISDSLDGDALIVVVRSRSISRNQLTRTSPGFASRSNSEYVPRSICGAFLGFHL
jgi:hypothetical protein